MLAPGRRRRPPQSRNVIGASGDSTGGYPGFHDARTGTRLSVCFLPFLGVFAQLRPLATNPSGYLV